MVNQATKETEKEIQWPGWRPFNVERILKVTKKSGNWGRCRKLSLWNCKDDISIPRSSSLLPLVWTGCPLHSHTRPSVLLLCGRVSVSVRVTAGQSYGCMSMSWIKFLLSFLFCVFQLMHASIQGLGHCPETWLSWPVNRQLTFCDHTVAALALGWRSGHAWTVNHA